MSDQLGNDSLSADEKAYFENRGEESAADAPADDNERSVTASAEDPTGDEDLVEEPSAENTEEGDDDYKPRSIRHAAFVKERALRKAAEQKLQEREQLLARFDERLKILQPPQQEQQEQPKVEIPDPEVDPIGYMKVLGQALGVMAEDKQKTEQQRQHERVEREVTTRYAQDAQRFSAETPDFKEAYQFLGAQRAQELFIASGKRATAEQIRDQLHREERSLAFQAMRSGMSPAEAVYEMAKARGYQARQAQAAEEQAEESIDRTARAQNANRSLSSAPSGGSAGGPMTMDKFLSMSDAQARAYMTKNPEAFRRLQNGQR